MPWRAGEGGDASGYCRLSVGVEPSYVGVHYIDGYRQVATTTLTNSVHARMIMIANRTKQSVDDVDKLGFS